MSMQGWTTLNLKELLDGDLARIRNVIRFSNSTRIKNESVAEHSFFTAYYSLMLAFTLVVEEHASIDFGEMLACAILHDVDEAKSGDFVRHFKYMNPEIKSHIEEATTEIMRQAFSPIFTKERAEKYHNEPANTLQLLWKNAKNPNTLEGDIVAFADFLSVLSYVMNEIDCGNVKLLRQLDDMYEYARSFNKRNFIKYEEVKAWLCQVFGILNQYGMKKEEV